MEATQQVVAEQSQNTDPASGSDQDGLLWGFHFVPNQPPRSISSEAAVEFLTAPGPVVPDEFLWLHFSLSNEASEPWLRRYLTLPDTFYESLHSDVDTLIWSKTQTHWWRVSMMCSWISHSPPRRLRLPVFA